MRVFSGLAGLLSGVFLFAAGAAQACQLGIVGEIPVVIEGNRALVDSEVDGQPVRLLLDSGAAFTSLFRDRAVRLGLTLRHSRGVTVYGVGGGEEPDYALLRELRINKIVGRDIDVVVTGRGRFGDASGLIGAPFLYQGDVEFDLAHGVVRVIQPKGCSGDQVVYWNKAYSVAPIIASNSSDVVGVEVTLDGTPVRAILDSGAAVSVVSTSAAERASGAGLKTAKPAGTMGGITGGPVEASVAQFATFGFGDETIRNTHIRVADMFAADTEVRLGSHIPTSAIDAPQMLLGFDFLMAHRVYVARSQGKVYVSYVGGPVFETGPKAPAARTPPASGLQPGAAP